MGSTNPNPFGSSFTLVGTTGVAGFNLVNATPNIFTWTSPNDGNMHRILVFSSMNVTVAQTGGAINLSFTDPGSTFRSRLMYNGGLGVGYLTQSGNTPQAFTVAPGSVNTLLQGSAQTAGAAVLWAEVWAS
jgi:hypothetical protein